MLIIFVFNTMVSINPNNLFFPILFSLILIISSINIGLNYYQENLKPTQIEKLNSKAEIKLFAYIAGAVINPGVYEINDNTKVIDLIAASGGYSSEADIEYVNQTLNLSQQVFNEDHIFVPPIQQASSTDESVVSTGSEGKISLNNASPEQLDSLPGVGEATAKKIIDNRPYKTLEDLKEVEGIGDKKFQTFLEFITL